MPRVSVYADRAPVRDAIARLFDELDVVEVADVASRPPWRAGDSPDDVVALDLGLPVADRLEVLGQAWRSLHPPRILFLACDDEPAIPDGDARFDLEDEDACRATIRELVEGDRDTARVSVRMRRRGPASGDPLSGAPDTLARPA